MNTKRAVTLAVVSTFGWSAGAYANAMSSHEIFTPVSISESAPMTAVQADDGQQRIIVGSTEGSNSSISISEAERSAAAQYATNPGGEDVYGVRFTSAPYSLSWAPATVETWDYYVLDTSAPDSIADFYVLDTSEPDSLAMNEDVYLLLPGYDVVTF